MGRAAAGERGFGGETLALSLLAHGVLAAILVWRLGEGRRVPEPPVMNVQLAPWPSERQAEPDRRNPSPPAAEDARARPDRSSVRPPATPPEAGDTAPVPAASQTAPQRLLGLRGCPPGGVGLTPEERQRCQDRLAQTAGEAGARPAPKLNLDRDGEWAASKNQEGILIRKPKNGCRPRVAGSKPRGLDPDPQDFTGGVTCAWSF